MTEKSESEANMNAQAIKKFVEEDQKLASECKFLVGQCNKWEQECSLYDHDRESLMEFGNEADERAKEAEIRVNELEEEVKTVTDQLKYYKHQYETLSRTTWKLGNCEHVTRSLEMCLHKRLQSLSLRLRRTLPHTCTIFVSGFCLPWLTKSHSPPSRFGINLRYSKSGITIGRCSTTTITIFAP